MAILGKDAGLESKATGYRAEADPGPDFIEVV